jgi:hypothetical protein
MFEVRVRSPSRGDDREATESQTDARWAHHARDRKEAALEAHDDRPRQRLIEQTQVHQSVHAQEYVAPRAELKQ